MILKQTKKKYVMSKSSIYAHREPGEFSPCSCIEYTSMAKGVLVTLKIMNNTIYKIKVGPLSYKCL